MPIDSIKVEQLGQVSKTIFVKRKAVYEFIKREFDILIALVCLTIGLPAYFILVMNITVDDSGNPFYVKKE